MPMVFPFFVLVDFVPIDLCRLKCTYWNVTVGHK
jgi:hypothetical protein